MDQEIDRMMFFRKLSIISFVLICVVAALIAAFLIVMSFGDYNGANSAFARIEDYGKIGTKTVNFEKCDTLYFFSEMDNGERTLFEDEIPKLKIVNSDKNCIEITAGESLLEKLRVEQKGDALSVSFDEDCYNSVNSSKVEYKGLYVETKTFEVTVYAPVKGLISSAEFDLDFEAPKTDKLIISVIGEVRKGSIYNIDTNILYCELNGASNVNVSGRVESVSQFKVRHNSKIDALGLSTPTVYTSSASQVFGLSYIKGENFSDYSFMSLGFFITIGLVTSLIVCICAFSIFRAKFVKQRKELDLYIENVETEGNFLVKE